jgi:hypothetical protein
MDSKEKSIIDLILKGRPNNLRWHLECLYEERIDLTSSANTLRRRFQVNNKLHDKKKS